MARHPVCAGGPIVAVYPEGIWFGGVISELLERDVVEHLRDGRPVVGAAFFLPPYNSGPS